MTQTVKHKYQPAGSDGAWKLMCSGCTCGWQGPTLKGQGREQQETAKAQWEEHVKQTQVIL